jgi:hypothetical protein
LRACRGIGGHQTDATPKSKAGPESSGSRRERFPIDLQGALRAVPNARSSATLGQEREGTGVVIVTTA